MTVSVNIFDEINAGYWDDGLEALLEAIVTRRKFVRDSQGAKNLAEFDHGTRVRLINIRPQRLVGATGTVNASVTPSQRGSLTVDIDAKCYHRLGRYSAQLSIPASSLERIE
jgi:hypothetical protein